jgi:ABC-type uncharacterized transport system substrate-binding protein
MDRRRFLLTSLAGAVAVPLAAEAQPAGKIYRIGTIWTTPTPSAEDTLRQALRERGWIEGQNFVFERRYSEGRNDRLPVLAAELVRLRPDLISTVGDLAALAAKAATTTIPVVFTAVGDPVGRVSSRVLPDRAGISRERVVQARNWLANGWNSSRRRFPRCRASGSSSTRLTLCTP